MSLRQWLWVFPILLVGYVTFVFGSLLLNDRQTKLVAERIRVIYGLPHSKYKFPIHYMQEIVREGMTLDEVQVAVGPIRPLVKAVSWHSVQDGPESRWVAERLLLDVPWGVEYPLDIFFRQKRVSNLDVGYYIAPENEISADSAARLLE